MSLLDTVIDDVQAISSAKDSIVAEQAIFSAIVEGPESGTGSLVTTANGDVPTIARKLASLDLLALAQPVLESRTAALAFDPETAPNYLVVGGYNSAGDGPFIHYKKVDSEPSHVAKLQIAEGSWYEVDELMLYSRMVGVHLSASDALDAFQAFVDAASALNIPAVVYPGDTYTFPSGTVDLPEGIHLHMSGATLVRSVDIDPGIALLQCIGTSDARKGNGRIHGGLLKYTAATTAHTITNNTALWLKFCHDWRVEDVSIEGAFYIGFRFDDCLDTTLDKFSVRGVYNRALYVAATAYSENVHCMNGLCDGFAVGTSTQLTNHIINTNCYGTGTGKNITFTNITSRNGSVSPAGEGFAFSERMSRQKAVNCRAYNCQTGFNIQSANGFANTNVQLVNCEAEGCARGFLGTSSNNIILTGCRSDNHSISGFEFNNCATIMLGSCYANGSGTGTCDGFLFEGTTGGVTIVGCIAQNNTGTGFKSTSGTSSIIGRGNHTSLNSTATNMTGLSGIDFPTSSGGGNLIL